MAIGTCYVFFLSKDQSESARVSANAASEAVNLSKQQFNAEHSPYLVVGDFPKIVFSKNKPFEVLYTIVNLGNAPVKTFRNVATWSIALNEVSDEEMINGTVKALDEAKDIPGTRDSYIYNKPKKATFINTAILSDRYYEIITRE